MLAFKGPALNMKLIMIHAHKDKIGWRGVEKREKKVNSGCFYRLCLKYPVRSSFFDALSLFWVENWHMI